VALGAIWSGAVTLGTALPITASLMLQKRGRSPGFCANVGIAGACLTLTGLAALNGGLEGPSLLWYTVLPVVAVLASGATSGVIWTIACTACLVGFAIAEACGVVFPQELSPSSLALFKLAVVMGLVVCHFVLAYVRVVIEVHASAALHEAKCELDESRRKFSRLEESRGYSVEQLWKLQKERAALIRFIRFKYGEFDRQFEANDDAMDDEFVIEDEPEEATDGEDETDLATIAIQTILAAAVRE
jgi:very-short-patch-repair endonuclease